MPLKQVREDFVGFEGLLEACFMLLFWLAYYVTVKMEATRSLETSADYQWTTKYYIPEDRTLQGTILVNSYQENQVQITSQ
jgi:hypothetical protein